MRFDGQKTVGSGCPSADTDVAPKHSERLRLVFAAALLIVSGMSLSQALYKYRGPDGEWIYSDRPPPDEQAVEVRDLPRGTTAPTVTVSHTLSGRVLRFSARNGFHAPVELILALDELHNVALPDPDQSMRWVLAPRSGADLLVLSAIADNIAPQVEYRYLWLPGDPASTHRPERPYRAPFAIANEFVISQAFPVGETHRTPDSRYAVDIAMPIGTDIYAAREGLVFEVASTNFRGGLDPARDAASANLVRILHDDGTHAVYAHLNWNSIRVKPGDFVERGEYIADSGNTGFSSGPHLHFAVMRNKGMRLESLPVVFEGVNSAEVAPATGNVLTAY